MMIVTTANDVTDHKIVQKVPLDPAANRQAA
jgi:hypothetical protein